MSLIRLLVILGLLLASTARAEDQVPESVLLKQRALPLAPPVPAAVNRVVPRAIAPRSVTPLAITGVTIQSPANPAAVPLFGTVELAIAITTDVAGVNRYNPDPASGGLDLSATFTWPGATPVVITRNGFSQGTGGSANWLVRFAPTVAGAWTCAVTAKDPSNPTGVTTASPGFTVVTSANPGFIRVSGSRLRFSGDGSLFYGIGHNNGWQGDVEQPSLPQMKSAYGENLLSFWLSQPWITSGNRTPIENAVDGIGNYNQTTCDYLDGVFQRAEANGVYLLPSIWSHDALRHNNVPAWGTGNWPNNAYSDPTICTFPVDFFIDNISGTDTAAWIRQARFFRYLIARYGHSTALAGWIGLVEMEGTTGYVSNSTAVKAWCRRVRDYFIANDPYRVASGTYPISFSKSDENSGANTLGAENSFPLHVADSYTSKNSTSAIANTIATATRTLGGFGTAGGAPAFHTEFGAPIGGGASDPLHFHNAIWAGVSAGACLMPLKWCDGGSWPLFSDATYGPDYRAHTVILSAFVNTPAVKAVMNNTSAIASTIAFPTSTGRVGWGLQGFDNGFAWLHRPAGGSMASTAVTLANCPAGHYLLDWYDPWTSGSTPASSDSTDISTGNPLALLVPAGITRGDVAVCFRRIFAGTNQSVTVDAKGNTVITLNGTGGGTLTVAAITTLPTRGTLFQTTNGGAKDVQITSAGPVSNVDRKVWYEASTPGADSFIFTVNDGTTSAPGTVSITVRNHAPSFSTVLAPVSTNEDIAYSTAWATNISSDNVTTNSAIDGPQTLTFLLTGNTNTALFSTQPAISSSTGVLSFTPAANRNGTATINVTLKDNGGTAGGGSDSSATVPLTITVVPVNHAPVASNVNVSTYAGKTTAITLVATDVDGDPLTYAVTSALTPPSAGTLSAVSGSTVTFTPAPSLVGPATVTFTYRATDNALPPATSPNATVTITVLANTPPTANAQSVTVAQNTATGITLTGSDDGVPNATLAFAVISGPTHGTLTGTAPFMTYQPSVGYTGADAFTFTVNDGATTSAAATVAITVNAGGGTTVPVGHTTAGGGCGLGGTAAVALLGLLGLLTHVSRLVRRRND